MQVQNGPARAVGIAELSMYQMKQLYNQSRHLLEEEGGGRGVGAKVDVGEDDGALRHAAQLRRRPHLRILPLLLL